MVSMKVVLLMLLQPDVARTILQVVLESAASGRRLLDYHGRGVDAASPMFGTDAPLRVATGFDDFSLIARPSDSKLIESC